MEEPSTAGPLEVVGAAVDVARAEAIAPAAGATAGRQVAAPEELDLARRGGDAIGDDNGRVVIAAGVGRVIMTGDRDAGDGAAIHGQPSPWTGGNHVVRGAGGGRGDGAGHQRRVVRNGKSAGRPTRTVTGRQALAAIRAALGVVPRRERVVSVDIALAGFPADGRGPVGGWAIRRKIDHHALGGDFIFRVVRLVDVQDPVDPAAGTGGAGAGGGIIRALRIIHRRPIGTWRLRVGRAAGGRGGGHFLSSHSRSRRIGPHGGQHTRLTACYDGNDQEQL